MNLSKKIKGIFKRWLDIESLEKENKYLKEQIKSHQFFVERKMSELKGYTMVDADVGMRTNNTIILTGVYRNKAYVRFYDLGDGEFGRMVDQLRDMRSHSLIRNIDAPPTFHGVFDI